MSHEITIREDGFAEAAYSLKPAWHGLGVVFDHAMSSLEALSGAGLDWEVRQEAIYRKYSQLELYKQVDGFALNIRSDTDKVLGMVSDRYRVVQNTEAFRFLDALVENHEMRYESAFSLYGGRRVVMLAQMPGVDEATNGDSLLRYILLSLSHDGTEAIKFGPVSVRVVCANTYAMAMKQGTTHELSIRHSGNIKEKLSQARDILGIASSRFAQYAEYSKMLARKHFTPVDWAEYLYTICPKLDKRDPDYTPRRARKLQETRDAINDCYHNERQATAPATAWAAYNAVSELVDHLPRRGKTGRGKAEARFNVCLYGTGMSQKERAFQTACRFAGIELSKAV